jgi:hypothetical protein
MTTTPARPSTAGLGWPDVEPSPTAGLGWPPDPAGAATTPTAVDIEETS